MGPPGLSISNILLLMAQIPKVQKKTDGLTVFLGLLGNARVKAVKCKKMEKMEKMEKM